MSNKAQQQETKPQTLQDAKAIAEAKAEELSAAHNCKVHPMVFKEIPGDGWVIGYIKEPSRAVKAFAGDKAAQGREFSVGAEIANACLIKEVSDPRTYSESPEHDKYVLGVWEFANQLVVIAIEQSKKK